jgi:hypothetical protein
MEVGMTEREEKSVILVLISVNLTGQKRNEERIMGGLYFAWTDR